MKRITVQSFTCVSVDQAMPSLHTRRVSANADRKLDKPM